MTFVFFGTPRFAAIIFQKLIAAGRVPAALVCNPDRPAGRKRMIVAPETKIAAIKANAKDGVPAIRILQPERLDEAFIARLKSVNSDFFIIAAYAKILKPEVLKIPRLGSIGVHPSLLPKLRGASPIQSAILEGAPETGVTLYHMDAGTDSGPILAQKPYQLATDETAETLTENLAILAGGLLADTIPAFYAGAIKPRPQNESGATFTKKFSLEDGFIDPATIEAAEHGERQAASRIDRMVRALNPEPGTWTEANKTRVKILGGRIAENRFVISKIQIAGKKPRELGPREHWRVSLPPAS